MAYTRCVKKITGILGFCKNIYSFVYINVIAYKLVLIRYYALMPYYAYPIRETLLKLNFRNNL